LLASSKNAANGVPKIPCCHQSLMQYIYSACRKKSMAQPPDSWKKRPEGPCRTVQAEKILLFLQGVPRHKRIGANLLGRVSACGRHLYIRLANEFRRLK